MFIIFPDVSLIFRLAFKLCMFRSIFEHKPIQSQQGSSYF